MNSENMTDSCEVPPCIPDPKAGYNFDPYRDPGQLVDTHNPNIPFHNYRQIHISEIAFWEGFHATKVSDIPHCPPLWQDVQHYWDMVSLAGFVSYHFGTKESWVLNIVTVAGAGGIYTLAKPFLSPLAATYGIILP